MDNKDQAKGKLEQAVGDLTDNKDLKDKGTTDEEAGDAKALVDKIGDQIGGLIDTTKKALTKD